MFVYHYSKIICSYKKNCNDLIPKNLKSIKNDSHRASMRIISTNIFIYGKYSFSLGANEFMSS